MHLPRPQLKQKFDKAPRLAAYLKKLLFHFFKSG